MTFRFFQVTHATFVQGSLHPGYFGLNDTDRLPRTILTEENPAIPFSAVGRWDKGNHGGQQVYKLFSRESLPDQLLDQMFAERTETERITWQAYPVLAPKDSWPSFVLAKGIYYVNAMESAVSTMETEIIASRNVVNHLLQTMSR